MYFPKLNEMKVLNVARVNDELDMQDPDLINLIQKYTLYDQMLYDAARRQALKHANNAPALFKRAVGLRRFDPFRGSR
jgi:hypothetical protein